jgi:hypothetical protein
MHSASPKERSKRYMPSGPPFHSASFHSYPVSILPMLKNQPNNQIVNPQRASPTDRQRRLLVPTHPEIASDSDSSSLEEGLKIEPIDEIAFWIHEVVVGEAGAGGDFEDCMVELGEGVNGGNAG